MNDRTSTIVYDEHWKKMEIEILNLVKKKQKGQGASFDELHLEVKDTYTRAMLRIVLQSLKSVGKIFNTMDDNNWMTSCLQEKLYDSIRIMESRSNFGANLPKIHKDIFKEKYSYEMLYGSVMRLAEEGRVYSTIDECHWMTNAEPEVYI